MDMFQIGKHARHAHVVRSLYTHRSLARSTRLDWVAVYHMNLHGYLMGSFLQTCFFLLFEHMGSGGGWGCFQLDSRREVGWGDK